MDLEARSSCLRAVQLVARSARLCASEDRRSDRYLNSVASAERMLERAQKYYSAMRDGHESHERAVRVVNAALVEAQMCVRQMRAGIIEADELAMQAAKIERAVARAEGIAPPLGAT